jgi:predicted phage terminase large subunit-like protein
MARKLKHTNLAAPTPRPKRARAARPRVHAMAEVTMPASPAPTAGSRVNATAAMMDTLLRQDLGVFIRRSFQILHPDTTLHWTWHLELLADRLMRVERGEIRRLIITVPPRSLKSVCASIAFPAWVLGRSPSTRLICASYGQDLSSKHARDTISLMRSPSYARAFPGTQLARSAVNDLETTRQGGRLATSVGGVMTGRGGDIVIVDDPTKPDEVLSDAQRSAANDWFDNTLLSRLNDKTTGAIIVIMQRQHLDDMVGHITSKGEAWEIVNLPAIATEDESWEYTSLGKLKTKYRSVGEALQPERESVEVLERLRIDMGSYVFEAQYQQSPVPLGGGLIKNEWLHRYTEEDLPTDFTLVVQSWDTASKESELSDYSVCTTWGWKDKKAYLLHVLRERLDYPALRRKMIAHAKRWAATQVLIEDQASGIQLIQEVKFEGIGQVIGIKPEGDKASRLQGISNFVENGSVLFPEEAHWWRLYEAELISFPRSRYKDQVDSTSQALTWLSPKWRHHPWTGPVSVPGPNAAFYRELELYTGRPFGRVHAWGGND